MCSDRVLVHYNPILPLVLTSDENLVRIATVLIHIIEGQAKSIGYASRSLTALKIYSQLDCETLAIIFGVSRFYNYVFGRHFTLITVPLTRIFAHNQVSPQMTSTRLLLYASFLSGFDCTVKLRREKKTEMLAAFL